MGNTNTHDRDKYCTRRGMGTAQEAANDCIQHATQSLFFLQECFELLGNLPHKTTFSEPSVAGLSSILDAILYDLTEARDYYLGDDDTPARM